MVIGMIQKQLHQLLINGWVHTGDIGEFDEEIILKLQIEKKILLLMLVVIIFLLLELKKNLILNLK